MGHFYLPNFILHEKKEDIQEIIKNLNIDRLYFADKERAKKKNYSHVNPSIILSEGGNKELNLVQLGNPEFPGYKEKNIHFDSYFSNVIHAWNDVSRTSIFHPDFYRGTFNNDGSHDLFKLVFLLRTCYHEVSWNCPAENEIKWSYSSKEEDKFLEDDFDF